MENTTGVTLEPLFDLNVLQINTDATNTINTEEPEEPSPISNQYTIDIRMYSKVGRQQDFIYDKSNVIFSKKNKIGKMRKCEVMIPKECPIDKVIVSVEVLHILPELSFGLKKDKDDLETHDILEFNRNELNQVLFGIPGELGVNFYLVPTATKKGRDLGPKHQVRICFEMGSKKYCCTIDSIFLAGHKHESGQKKKIIQVSNHNCIHVTIDTNCQQATQKVVMISSKY